MSEEMQLLFHYIDSHIKALELDIRYIEEYLDNPRTFDINRSDIERAKANLHNYIKEWLETNSNREKLIKQLKDENN